MNKLKIISASTILFWQLIAVFFSVAHAAIVTPLDNPQLITLAKTLPNQGVLKQLQDGYTYLELSPSFSTRLPGLLNEQDLIFDRPQIGSHITLFTVDDVNKYHIFAIPELNSNYTFNVIGLNRVSTKHCVGMQDGKRIWYVLSVDAPELTALRKKYVFSNRKFNLHISLAYQQITNPNKLCESSAIREFSDF